MVNYHASHFFTPPLPIVVKIVVKIVLFVIVVKIKKSESQMFASFPCHRSDVIRTRGPYLPKPKHGKMARFMQSKYLSLKALIY